MVAQGASGSISPLILILGTVWRRVVSFTPRSFCLYERTEVLIEYEDGWAPESVWAFWERQKSLFPAVNWVIF
jgi:ABC-type uncharacterized transport system permease subunit